MNEEQYVTYKVGKLLKEKGFDWRTNFVWYEHLPVSIDWRNKANQKAMDYFYSNETTEQQSKYSNLDKKPSYIYGDIYSAPTQQMACHWLREVHNILICILPYEVGAGVMDYTYCIYRIFCDDLYFEPLAQGRIEEAMNYEKTLEAGLEFVLTNVI